MGEGWGGGDYFIRSYGKTDFSIILSEAKDVEPTEKTRFFTTFRMTKFLSQVRGFAIACSKINLLLNSPPSPNPLPPWGGGFKTRLLPKVYLTLLPFTPFYRENRHLACACTGETPVLPFDTRTGMEFERGKDP
jgi:hypothetical protein